MEEPSLMLMSAVFALAFPVGFIIGRRVYPAEGRRAARSVWLVYLAGLGGLSTLGLTSFAWVYLHGVPSPWLSALFPLFLLPVLVIQWRLETAMGYTGWLVRWYGRRFG